MSSWTKIAHQTLGSAGTLTADWSSLSTNYEHLKVICLIKNANNGRNIGFRFNDLTDSDYGSIRRYVNAGSQSNSTSGTGFINTGMDSYQSDHMIEMIIANPAPVGSNYAQRMVVGHVSGSKSDVGGFEFRARFGYTQLITKITSRLEFTSGTNGDIASGSYITVWGADDAGTQQIYPKLQDGTIYEEQDTGKIYIWNLSTNTWSEVK